MTPQQAAALTYARRGLPVFPVKPRDKKPLIKSAHPEGDPARGVCHGECGWDGHGLWDGTVDLDRVRAWWDHWPTANVGVRTGERFDVLDLDGAKGIASMEAFAAEHGFSLGEPAAPTPGGGRHHFFEPTGLGNAAGLLEGVDWRGRGGYVVVGPSVHPNGKQYAEIPATADRPPFVPAPLRALLEPPKTESAPPRATFRPGDTTTRYARAALEDTYRRILESAPKTRNDTAFREGASLFELVAGGVVADAEAAEAISAAMAQLGKRSREIAGTVASARRTGMQRPRGIPAEPSVVRLPPPGAVLREDSFTAWASGKAQVAPSGHETKPQAPPAGNGPVATTTNSTGQPPGTRPRTLPEGWRRSELLEIDYRIGEALLTYATPAGCWPSIPRLAQDLGVTSRYIRERLAYLEQVGLLKREPVFERGDDPNWVKRDRRSPHPGRQTSSLYHLTDTLFTSSQFRGPPGTGVEGGNSASALLNPPELSHFDSRVSSALEEVRNVPPTPTAPPALVELAPDPEPDPEPWPADERGDPVPVRLHVPEADRLDHDPTAAEILGAIGRGLGEVRVLGAVRHDDPDAAAKLEAIHAGAAPLPDGWSWRTWWRPTPVGPCARCGQPSHTRGPDGRPWHPYCWGAAGTPPPRLAYQAGTRVRQRSLPLAGDLEDFHRAVDALDRDTCMDPPCRPGAPCRRHTRRKREE